MDPLITAFYANTYTQADARRRVTLLESAIEQSVYTQGANKTIQQCLADLGKNPQDVEILTTYVQTQKLPKDSTVMKKFLTELRDSILACPVASLSLPFEPNNEQIIAYGQWFRANVNPLVLLTLIFDASVVGGCSVTWQGKQVTYDLAYLIKQRRVEIVAVVDQFVEIKKKEVVI